MKLTDSDRLLLTELREELIKARDGYLHEDPPSTSFTEREKDVCFLLAAGYTNRVIAESLKLTYGTVNTYIQRIYSKLDVPDEMDNRVYTALAFRRLEQVRVRDTERVSQVGG